MAPRGLEILLILWFHGNCTASRFLCPPPEDIRPCECRAFPTAAVRCDGIASLASVRAALNDRFELSLPRLRLTRIHTFSLPSRALGDLSPRRLYLEDSNIRSIADDAFQGQGDLGLLVMAGDRMEDIPAKSLGLLTGLRTLSLAGNFLMRVREGSFGGLNGLRILVLSDNRISEIERKAFPRNLESLMLSRNLVSTLNGSLHVLGRLVELFVTDNRLTGVQCEFEGLESLEYLHLDRNHLSDVSEEFGALKSLSVLSLSGNRIRSVGSGLSGLKSLRVLDMSHNYITELDAKPFEKLRELEVLDLSGNYLKSVCPTLRLLEGLRELRLSDVHLRRLDPDCFRNMKNLETLDLSRNLLTEVSFNHSLPSLAKLRLGHNRLTALNYGLRTVKSLRELDIGHNHLSSLGEHHLSQNRELATLKIGGNPWKCTELLFITLQGLKQNNIDIQGQPRC